MFSYQDSKQNIIKSSKIFLNHVMSMEIYVLPEVTGKKHICRKAASGHTFIKTKIKIIKISNIPTYLIYYKTKLYMQLKFRSDLKEMIYFTLNVALRFQNGTSSAELLSMVQSSEFIMTLCDIKNH